MNDEIRLQSAADVHSDRPSGTTFPSTLPYLPLSLRPYPPLYPPLPSPLPPPLPSPTFPSPSAPTLSPLYPPLSLTKQKPNPLMLGISKKLREIVFCNLKSDSSVAMNSVGKDGCFFFSQRSYSKRCFRVELCEFQNLELNGINAKIL